VSEPVSVWINGVEVPLVAGVGRLGGIELELHGSDLSGGMRWDWSLHNAGRSAATVQRVGLRLRATPEMVLEHGWQSWSPVRSCPARDARPSRRAAPRWVSRMLLAEGEVAGVSVRGDHFLVSDLGVVGALGGAHNLTTIECHGRTQGLTTWALLDGVPLHPGREMRLDPLWIAAGDPGRLYSSYASLWGEAEGARRDAPSEPGWCSWYQYFGNVDLQAIGGNLDRAAEHGLRVLQIDDGYQRIVGDWLAVRDGWGPMSELAAAIVEEGLRPGIWTAPFLVAAHGGVARDHPDWLLRQANGHPVPAHHNPSAWGGWALALDMTHPGALEHVTEVAAQLHAAGFSYHKADFCYAAALPGRHHDPTATRAEALARGLRAFREGIGERAFLLGCGCPLGPAAGVVDAMRVSPDTGPWWAPRPGDVVKGFAESAVCLANAARASLLRAPLHRRLWINDPDCLLLRPTDTKLSGAQRRLAADLVAGLGCFLMLSDDLSRYRAEEWLQVERIRKLQSTADTPLDIDDPLASQVVVRSAATVLTVDPTIGRGDTVWSLQKNASGADL
jgi:alpha-galactosidase